MGTSKIRFLIIGIAHRTIICYTNGMTGKYLACNVFVGAMTNLRVVSDILIGSKACYAIIRIGCADKWIFTIFYTWRLLIIESLSDVENFNKRKFSPRYVIIHLPKHSVMEHYQIDNLGHELAY